MTKPKQIEVINPFKIVLYLFAFILLFVSIIQLTYYNTSDFSWTVFLFTLIFGIIIIKKAKKIKPITTTIDNTTNSNLTYDENYYLKTQIKSKSKIDTRTAKTVNYRRNLKEDDIYGLAYDLAGEGLEDEVRDSLDLDRKDYDHHFDGNDNIEEEFDKH